MTVALTKHPAPWHALALDEVARMVTKEQERVGSGPIPLRLLDPFAGTGRIHQLMERVPNLVTVGVELEPEWAACHPLTVVGNALSLPANWSRLYRILATDPTYGNRMADKHNAQDPCKACEGTGYQITNDVKLCKACKGMKLSRRHTYRHTLGRPLTRSSSAGLQWGKAYRQFHELFIREALRVVVPDGLIIIAMKNHIRDGKEQRVAEWWLNTLLYHECRLAEVVPIPLNGVTHGQNHEKRVDDTLLIAVRTPAAA